MRRLLSVLLGLAFFAMPSMGSEPMFTCWDLSYYMNYASMMESENRFELAIEGAGIGTLHFQRYDEVINIEPWNFNKKVYVQFAKNECTIATDRKSGHCEKAGSRLWDAFFIGRDFDNLGERVAGVTSVPADKVTLDYSSTNIKVSFYGAYYNPDGPVVQSIEFPFNQCYAPDSYKIEFPQALKDYLNKWYPKNS